MPLPFEYVFLAFDTPAVSAGGSVFTYDSMTGNHDGHAIRAAGTRDCPDCIRLSDGFCKIFVTPGFPSRDVPESLPDFLLKCRAANVQREFTGTRIQGLNYLFCSFTERTAMQAGKRHLLPDPD